MIVRRQTQRNSFVLCDRTHQNRFSTQTHAVLSLIFFLVLFSSRSLEKNERENSFIILYFSIVKSLERKFAAPSKYVCYLIACCLACFGAGATQANLFLFHYVNVKGLPQSNSVDCCHFIPVWTTIF